MKLEPKMDFLIYFTQNCENEIYQSKYEAKFWNTQIAPQFILICWG